jgi:NCAIR mutase (PurE)-related protein
VDERTLRNLQDDARPDIDRELRTGQAEAIYGPGKTPEQVRDLVAALAAASEGPVFVTRATPEQHAAAVEAVPDAEYHVRARLVVAGRRERSPAGTVLVITAGTSDLPVADEAAVVAESLGLKVERLTDVGIAGVHRVLAERDAIEAADAVIVVAGMEGALPSLVAGLTSRPVIAVPTSVGYGAAFEGLAALLGMLNSCSGGVAVVNIDNGFGAAQFAYRMLRERETKT